MTWDLKTIADTIAAVAALVAAIQSWRAKGDTKQIRTQLLQQQQQSQSQTLAPQININVSTVGQGQPGGTTPIFEKSPESEQLPP
ncbi:MAG TPA: DUF2756 domain-containing protein, partial [Terriglobales bacterium]|nr:DUF2756 domain-containing protein [Terriglobales bacterium]